MVVCHLFHPSQNRRDNGIIDLKRERNYKQKVKYRKPSKHKKIPKNKFHVKVSKRSSLKTAKLLFRRDASSHAAPVRTGLFDPRVVLVPVAVVGAIVVPVLAGTAPVVAPAPAPPSL